MDAHNDMTFWVLCAKVVGSTSSEDFLVSCHQYV